MNSIHRIVTTTTALLCAGAMLLAPLESRADCPVLRCQPGEKRNAKGCCVATIASLDEQIGKLDSAFKEELTRLREELKASSVSAQGLRRTVEADCDRRLENLEGQFRALVTILERREEDVVAKQKELVALRARLTSAHRTAEQRAQELERVTAELAKLRQDDTLAMVAYKKETIGLRLELNALFAQIEENSGREITVAVPDWYGWKIAAVDGALLGMSYLLDEGGESSRGFLVVSGPILHLAHQEFGRAWWSLGLRGAAVGMSFLLHEALGTWGDEVEEQLVGATPGLVIDWLIVARRTTTEETSIYELLPFFKRARDGGLQVGVVGQF